MLELNIISFYIPPRFPLQFVYWGWISNAMYLGAMGAMQGHSPEKISNKIQDSLWGLMKAQWAFWVPVQLLNFNYVPVRHQLNVVLLTSVVWTALLSFWYPPDRKAKAPANEELVAPAADE
jgi:Mpv17 / PMP22 family